MMIPRPTSHIIFLPEVDVASIQLTSRRVWPPEAPLNIVLQQPTPHIRPVQGQGDGMVLKPRGEVNEVNKGGYSLQKVLNWEMGQYKDVQVWGSAL